MRKNIELWQKEHIPEYNKDYGKFTPSITDYTLKSKTKNSCFLVIPGGAYAFRADGHEGKDIAKFFNDNGISAFVLNYRVAPYSYPAMDEDVKRAIRYIRFNSDKFGIDENKIGVIGFSAGGHLSCIAGLDYDYGKNDGDDIDKVSCRPNLVVPCYAVSSICSSITHQDTKNNYLGNNDENLLISRSAENMIKDDTPPFFIWHTVEDSSVDVRLSLTLAESLKAKNIPFELHIFPYGPHGQGLAKSIPLANDWPELLIKWVRYYNF